MSTEKAQDSHVEDSPPEGTQWHIDPALEKRVVRKLDWNFVPLVVALCKCSHTERRRGETLTASRPGFLPRQVKYRERRGSRHEQGCPRVQCSVPMAFDHLLHSVYSLRVVGAHVEDRASTHLGVRDGSCLVSMIRYTYFQ